MRRPTNKTKENPENSEVKTHCVPLGKMAGRTWWGITDCHFWPK